MEIQKLRQQIDSLDKKIVQLLNTRAEISRKIALLKKQKGKSLYSPDREQDVLKKVNSFSQGLLGKEALTAIYREIMSASLTLQEPLRVAYLGPEASFSHLAALKRFGSQVEFIACDTITDVFLEVERGSADYGVAPVENSVEGVVSHTLDMLVDSELKIAAQVILNVSHNLLSNCPLGKIKKIYSNPQVFGQCRNWLRRHLPNCELIEVTSTTKAAMIASQKKDSACIASLLAAKIYKLKVLAKDIADSPHNATRFLVIGKTDSAPTGNDRTSLLFSIKDRVGALHQMLTPFKKYRINLTKIESRPSKKKAWDYYFFVDIEGHKDDTGVKKALRELEDQCKFLKILGSYPVGD